jgi:hypothetical protein
MFSNLFSLFNFRDAGSYLPDLLRGALISVELTLSVMALSLVFGPGRRAGPAVAVQARSGWRDVLRRGHPRHPVHAAALLHLLRAARVRASRSARSPPG